MTRKINSTARRIAQQRAEELADLERQQRALRAEIRTKRREARKAEAEELETARRDLGAWLAEHVGATSAEAIDDLREWLSGRDAWEFLSTWAPPEQHAEESKSDSDAYGSADHAEADDDDSVVTDSDEPMPVPA